MRKWLKILTTFGLIKNYSYPSEWISIVQWLRCSISWSRQENCQNKSLQHKVFFFNKHYFLDQCYLHCVLPVWSHKRNWIFWDWSSSFQVFLSVSARDCPRLITLNCWHCCRHFLANEILVVYRSSDKESDLRIFKHSNLGSVLNVNVYWEKRTQIYQKSK